MNAKTYVFENGPTCSGVGVVAPVDRTHDIITIQGSYPRGGFWARNSDAREEVIIVSGEGEVILRGAHSILLDSKIPDKRAVVIEPGQWFRWQSFGGMVLSMVCEPGFDPNKYEVKLEEEIE